MPEGEGGLPPQLLRDCEEGILSDLPQPHSYQRGEVAFDGAPSEPGVQHVYVEYFAEDASGTVIRKMEICRYPLS